MVELKSSVMSSVSTQDTRTTGLGYKHLLDFAPPARNGFGTTLATSKASFGLDCQMPDQPMSSTFSHDIVLPRPMRGVQHHPTFAPLGPEAVSSKPVANRRASDTQSLGDPLDRQALFHQGLELLARHAARRAMTGRTGCLKAMLPQPIADRRRMLSHPLTDRFERHSLRQAILQEPLLHAEIIAPAADRKLR
jgi:hypothetical protein